MKQHLIIFALLFTSILASAQIEQFNAANKLYAEQKFEEAAKGYESIIKSGVENKELYFNLGNAFYKSGNLPKAILNFERALLLDPSDDDIIYNLELANTQSIDRIENTGQIFIARWFKSIINLGSGNFWAIVFIICFALSLAVTALFFVTKNSLFKRISFYSGVVLLVVMVVSWSFGYQLKSDRTNRDTAIVMAPTVTVKSSPDNSGTDLFVIHEGTKVIIIETLGAWSRIKLRDGSTGFLPSFSIEVI